MPLSELGVGGVDIDAGPQGHGNTLVRPDQLRPSILPRRYVPLNSRMPAGRDQGGPELVGDLVRAGPDQPGREAQDPVAGDPDLVLSPHVRRPLAYVHVVRPVHLDVQAPSLPVRVQVANPAGRVGAPLLQVGRR
jgi:hypothetical protein